MREQAPLREIWRETRPLVRRVQARYVGAAVAVILSTLITLAGPALVRYAVDSGIDKGKQKPLDIAAVILWAGTWMTLGYVFSDALEVVATHAARLGNWLGLGSGNGVTVLSEQNMR